MFCHSDKIWAKSTLEEFIWAYSPKELETLNEKKGIATGTGSWEITFSSTHQKLRETNCELRRFWHLPCNPVVTSPLSSTFSVRLLWRPTHWWTTRAHDSLRHHKVNPSSHSPLQCVKFFFLFFSWPNFFSLFYSWCCLTKKTNALDCLLCRGECLLTVSFVPAGAVDVGTGFSYSHRHYRAILCLCPAVRDWQVAPGAAVC